MDDERVLCQSPSDNIQVQAFLNGNRMYVALNNIVLGVDEFALLTVQFDEPPAPAKTVDERVFYADKVIVPINRKQQNFKVEMPDVHGPIEYAKLRVSVTRVGGFGVNPHASPDYSWLVKQKRPRLRISG